MDETISLSIAGLVSSGTVTSRERKALATIGVEVERRLRSDGKTVTATKQNELAKLSPARRSAVHAHAWEFLSQIVDFQGSLLHKRANVAGLLSKKLNLERQDDDDDYTVGIELVGVAVEPIADAIDLGLASEEINDELELPGFDGRPVGENSQVQAAFDEAVDQVNQLMAALGIERSTEAAGSAIRASYGILVEDTTVQALARENDPSQVAGTEAFKNKGFGALVQAARESQEVFETITADPDNLDRFLEVLAHMIVAAKDEQESK